MDHRSAPRISADDERTVRQALLAAVDGPFFPNWEFDTLVGVDRATARGVAHDWPDLGADRDGAAATVVNVLNNLPGYPHGHDDELSHRVPGGRDAVAGALRRLTDAGF